MYTCCTCLGVGMSILAEFMWSGAFLVVMTQIYTYA